MAEVVIATDQYGDWEGLYVDGRLIDEDHSLQLLQVLRHVADLGPFTVSTRECRVDARLPSDINDVVWND